MKKNWLLLSALFSLNAVYAAPAECPLEFGPFSEDMCHDKDFFETIGPDEIKKINTEILAEPFEEIFKDNAADPKVAVEEITIELRNYAACFYKLCDQIATDCANVRSGTANPNIPDQTAWCEHRRDKFIDLQMVKAKYFLTHNTARKHRSLYEEKIARIGYRFYKYLVSTSLSDTIRLIAKVEGRISELINHPKQ